MLYVVLIIVLILILILKWKKAAIKGRIGEEKCSFILSLLPTDKYIVVNDVLLNNDYGSTQIDHVVLSTYGIFVIETKNYSGWIYGGDNSESWTKNVYGNKYSFYNPLKQNYGHIKAIQEFLGLTSTNNIIGIVAFSNDATLKIHTNNNVVNFRNLLRCIKKYNNSCFDYITIEALANQLRNNVNYTREDKKEHVSEIKEKIEKNENKINEGICPRCGGKLIERKGKYGAFYGCSNYPRCRYTKNF